MIINSTNKNRTLTQIGLNQVLWMLIKSKGGRVVIREADLKAVPPSSALKVEHHSESQEFVLSLTMAKTSPIIVPGRN